MSYDMAHKRLSHPSKLKTQETAKKLGWILNTYDSAICESCHMGKARQKDMNKTSEPPTTKPGEQLMINIRTIKIKHTKKKIKHFWLLIHDEATNMRWSHFLVHKNEQVPIMIAFIKQLKEMKMEKIETVEIED